MAEYRRNSKEKDLHLQKQGHQQSGNKGDSKEVVMPFDG